MQIKHTLFCTCLLLLACCNSPSHESSSATSDTGSNFESTTSEQEVAARAENEQIQVLDFSATWCGPCQQLAPYFEKWEQKYASAATFKKIDIDDNQEMAEEYDITAVPTIVILDHNDKELARITGFDPEGIEEDIREALALVN